MIDQYLGLRYDRRKFNCLHFACILWETITGESLTALFPGLTDGPVTDRTFNRTHRGSFARLTAPVSPCLAIFHARKQVPHVGVFYNGKVAHLRENGVIYQNLSNAMIGFDSVRFYKCK